MMPPVMPPVIIIVVIGIIVVAIIVSRVVRVTRIVIAVVIGSVVPRTAAKRDTESLCLRIVLADRQQSQDRQCDDEKSFHGTSLILDGSTAAHIRQSAERAVAESLKFAPAIGASGIVYICASRALETINTPAALCHVKRVKPSGLHSSLPTPWWTIKRPMGSYFAFTSFNFG